MASLLDFHGDDVFARAEFLGDVLVGGREASVHIRLAFPIEMDDGRIIRRALPHCLHRGVFQLEFLAQMDIDNLHPIAGEPDPVGFPVLRGENGTGELDILEGQRLFSSGIIITLFSAGC